MKKYYKKRDVLLLNVGWQPVKVIDWKTAVNLIFGEKVTPGTSTDFAVVGTARGDYLIPKILVLKTHRESRVPRIRFSRIAVLKRDNFICAYCGVGRGEYSEQYQRRLVYSDFSIDHILPVSQGGGDSWDNVVCSCILCNIRKDNMTPEEAGMNLKYKPYKPEGFREMYRKAIPECWLPFVKGW